MSRPRRADRIVGREVPFNISALLATTHERAMQAKEAVFVAQDALSLAMSAAAELRDLPTQRSAFRVLDKLAKRLGQARAALEAFDRESEGRR